MIQWHICCIVISRILHLTTPRKKRENSFASLDVCFRQPQLCEKCWNGPEFDNSSTFWFMWNRIELDTWALISCISHYLFAPCYTWHYILQQNKWKDKLILFTVAMIYVHQGPNLDLQEFVCICPEGEEAAVVLQVSQIHCPGFSVSSPETVDMCQLSPSDSWNKKKS